MNEDDRIFVEQIFERAGERRLLVAERNADIAQAAFGERYGGENGHRFR
ncbi:MAG: hypothetical protein M5R36_05465 [Deltaproteobacteria bacterium]|nr:hypothetical protein [Deltaproteobacteria bacterium]